MFALMWASIQICVCMPEVSLEDHSSGAMYFVFLRQDFSLAWRLSSRL